MSPKFAILFAIYLYLQSSSFLESSLFFLMSKSCLSLNNQVLVSLALQSLLLTYLQSELELSVFTIFSAHYLQDKIQDLQHGKDLAMPAFPTSSPISPSLPNPLLQSKLKLEEPLTHRSLRTSHSFLHLLPPHLCPQVLSYLIPKVHPRHRLFWVVFPVIIGWVKFPLLHLQSMKCHLLPQCLLGLNTYVLLPH